MLTKTARRYILFVLIPSFLALMIFDAIDKIGWERKNRVLRDYLIPQIQVLK